MAKDKGEPVERVATGEAGPEPADRWVAYPVIVLVLLVTAVLATVGVLPLWGSLFPAGPPHLH